jgi:hypothetical protein
MGFKNVKEWLDKLVDNQNELRNLKYCNSQIELCGPTDTIHIFRGIEKIADAVGVELQMICDDSREYPYRYFFRYRGWEVTQIEEKQIVGVTDGTN